MENETIAAAIFHSLALCSWFNSGNEVIKHPKLIDLLIRFLDGTIVVGMDAEARLGQPGR